MRLFVIAIALAAGCNQSKSEEAKEPPPMVAPATVTTGSATPPAGSAAPASAGSAAAAPQPIPPYTPAASVPEPIKAAIAATDRSDDDRRLDAGRKPGEVLAFFGVAPGMKIGELWAGSGYTTELMARVVGDSGAIYAENTKEYMAKVASNDKAAGKPASPMGLPLTERAQKPVMQHVAVVERPLDAPFPPEAKQLDLVVTVLNYHDTVRMNVDRAAMNKAVFAALKKGGVYAVVDSSAVAGSGTRDVDTLHRIDEDVVKKEVQAAGFKLAGESDVLRNPSDARDWNSSPKVAGVRRGTSDRFVLKFVK